MIKFCVRIHTGWETGNGELDY